MQNSLQFVLFQKQELISKYSQTLCTSKKCIVTILDIKPKDKGQIVEKVFWENIEQIISPQIKQLIEILTNSIHKDYKIKTAIEEIKDFICQSSLRLQNEQNSILAISIFKILVLLNYITDKIIASKDDIFTIHQIWAKISEILDNNKFGSNHTITLKKICKETDKILNYKNSTFYDW